MRDENQHHCRNQQPNLVLQEELFGDQKGTTDIKKEQRLKAVVVPTETVPERIRANGNRQTDHTCFEPEIVDDVDTKKRQGGKKQRHNGTMNCASQGGANPQCIPVDLSKHRSKLQISNSVAKFTSRDVPLCLIMTKKGWTYLTFFAVLVGLFYLMLIQLIPGFSQPKVNPVSFVRPFRFTNQDGQAVTEKDFTGTVYVAEFFFTTCKGICPRMNNNMRTVYEAFKDEPNFRILSHTCDPETDSVPQMKKYSDSLKVDTKRWIFVTGRKDSLYTAARVSYTIDDPANNPANIEDDFLHTQFWALIDQNGDVRKVVDGLKPSEIDDLIESARELFKNPPLKK